MANLEELLIITLFNDWHSYTRFNVHKSKHHSNGDPCDDGFLVSATLPVGKISLHQKMENWDFFFCDERERAPEEGDVCPEDVLRAKLDKTIADVKKSREILDSALDNPEVKKYAGIIEDVLGTDVISDALGKITDTDLVKVTDLFQTAGVPMSAGASYEGSDVESIISKATNFFQKK